MGTVSTFPDGSQLTSTALTLNAINLLLQQVVCGIFNLNAGFQTVTTFIAGSNVVSVASTSGLFVGQAVLVPGVEGATTVTEIDGLNVTLSQPMTIDGSFVIAYGADPDSYKKVRIGWQSEGQPGWEIWEDITTIEATLVEDSIFQMRNQIDAANDSQTLLRTTQYTRPWRVDFTLYGPNSLDRARLIQSALLLAWTHDAFALSRLWMLPNLKTPKRMPELFDEQYWERVDFSVMFYEGVEETITVPLMRSVQVFVEQAAQTPAGYGITPYGSGGYGEGQQTNTVTEIDISA